MADTVVTYNGYSIPNVTGVFVFSKDEKSISFSCNFLLLAATTAALVALCKTAASKLTAKNKNLVVNFGGTEELNFSHAASTGFLARPKLGKAGDELCTATSRSYKFSVNIQLPFAQAGYSYRREGNFAVTHGPTRQRTVSFTCVYTAGGGQTALERYQGGVGTWVNTVLTLLTGDYEKVGEDYSTEHANKILRGRLQYREILALQAAGTTDYAAIVDPRVTFAVDYGQRTGLAPSTHFYMRPRVVVSINYSTSISRAEVAASDDLEDVYQTVVKPYLISRAYALLGLADYHQAGTQYIVESEKKSVNPYTWQITGSLIFSAPHSMNAILELSETLRETENTGLHCEKLWDGEEHTYNVWGIGGTKTLTRSVSVVQLGYPPAAPPAYQRHTGKGKWMQRQKTKVASQEGQGQGTAGVSLIASTVYKYTFVDEYIFVAPTVNIPVTRAW